MPGPAHRPGMDAPNLYYSPGACSLAAHVVLEEIGAPFPLPLVSIAEGANLTEDSARIHPLQRVPALATRDGVLTEVSAIVHHLADTHPDSALAPSPGDPLRARSYEWGSFLASSVHVAFAQIWRSARFTAEASAWPEVREEGLRAVARSFHLIEAKLATGPFALGARYGVIDPYLLVMHRWGYRVGVSMDAYPVSWSTRTASRRDRP